MGANPTYAHIATLRDPKKDCKTLFYIQQNVDAHHFEKLSKVTRLKETCDILEKYDKGDKVKLQSLRRKYELMQENHKINYYFSKLIDRVN